MSAEKQRPVRRLCEAIESAKEASFQRSDRLCAERIRRLALQLPRGPKREACQLSPFGIRIVGATIRGRLDLDNATPAGGGPLCPLEFRDCLFEGGFTGTHAHFSRLSFRGCEFRDPHPAPAGAEPEQAKAAKIPTIDLSGAAIGADLSLRGVKPADGDNHLWIRAIGARIAGEIDLSCSALKAPPEDPKRLFSEPSVEALDLSLAEIHGDVQFLNGSDCTGRMNFRNCHVTGDIWMSGAKLTASSSECLFLQSARIDGSVMLDGRAENADETGDFLPLVAVGEINLVEARIGGSLDITDVDLKPGQGNVCLRLIDARVGTTATIGSRRAEKARIGGRIIFQGLQATAGLVIRNVYVGGKGEEADGPATIDLRSLVAKRLVMFEVEPFLCDERDSRDVAPAVGTMSLDLGDASVETLDIVDCRFSGSIRANPLTCSGDATLDARVDVEVDLERSEIEGSLDISGLRLDRDARGLSLRDATIGRALQFARTTRPEGPLQELMKARTTELICLPGTTLIETLWRYRATGDKMLFCQVAFLRKGSLIRPLDSRGGTIEAFVSKHGHEVVTPPRAEEYVRMAAAYGSAGGDEPVWLLRQRGDAPFVKAAPESVEESTPQPAADSASAPPQASPAAGDDAAAQRKPMQEPPPERFGLTRIRERADGQDHFVISGSALHGDRYSYVSFRVTPGEVGQGPAASYAGLNIIASFGEPFGPPLVDMPVSRGLYLYHPPAVEENATWIAPRVTERPREVRDRKRLLALEALLLPYVQPGAAIHGRVDLTDLSCDTLKDGGGASWGPDLLIRLDRFYYRKATWLSDPPDEGFRPWAQRFVNRLIAERAPLRLIEWKGWRETRLQLGDFWEPWQIRRNWIYQQFELEPALPSPTRHRIDRSEYSPQPFEQAIRVARNEGREDFAAQFEILKRRIEWSLFSHRARRPLLVIGIVAATAWLMLTGGFTHGTTVALAGLAFACFVATRAVWPAHPWLGGLAHGLVLLAGIAGTTRWLGLNVSDNWETARNFIAALLIVVGVRFISTTSDWLMRNLFGYLRLPINAIVSLIVAFLVGWAGVDLANDRKMLVIDVEPVASLVARDATQQKIYVGTFRGPAGAYNVHCDEEIDEALYALDVLIPLIDLRQENRCEVGRAVPFDESDKDKGKTVAYAAERVLGPILDSEGFWAAAKALYAIAGWFLVSLAILTFAVANRAHGEPNG